MNTEIDFLQRKVMKHFGKYVELWLIIADVEPKGLK